jgi:nickel-dependent lactate racemase
MPKSIALKQDSWFSDRNAIYDFPENWDVYEYAHRPLVKISGQEIENRINQPVASEKLEQLVRPGQRILIICDDISRPTPLDPVLPLLFKILLEQGIHKDQISLLVALGSHEPMSAHELALKLGMQTVSNHTIHQHHPRRNNVLIGRTKLGTPVYINRLLMEHDLVLGLGGIYPHNLAGFSGGTKLILGVSGIKTILTLHRNRKGAGVGGDINNEFRQDLLEIAQMAKLKFIINLVLDKNRDIVEVVSGDPENAFHKGVDFVRTHFTVPHPDSQDFDLVLADVYPFDTSYAFARKGLWPIHVTQQKCMKLIVASMTRGMGGHLVFPIPNSQNRLKKLTREWRHFGTRYFLKYSLGPKFSKFIKKYGKAHKASNPPGRLSASRNSRVHQTGTGHPVMILHQAADKERLQLEKLPHLLFDDPVQCFDHINECHNYRPLRVALYRNASLTFPQNIQKRDHPD